MAKTQTINDKFANTAFSSVTETAANTLTFAEINSNVSLFDKVGWIIHRVEYFPTPSTIALLIAGDDQFVMGIVVSNRLSTISLQDPAVIDLMAINMVNYGAAANGMFYNRPIVKDFTNLPGGGLIIPPRPLYTAAMGASLAAAGTFNCRIHFTVKELKPEDYWELVEARRMVE